MKVYTEITLDMRSLKVIEESSFEYEGPVAECCGGGSPPDPPPPPPPPKPPKAPSAVTTAARSNQKDKTRKAMGQKSTLMTGGLGLDTKAQTSEKKLLGGGK